jgi:hypothetical protein
MVKDLDRQIQKAQTEFDDIIKQMTKTYQDFLNATVEFFQSWYPEQAKEMAIKKPHITKRIGEANISRLKQKIQELQNNAGDTVSEFLQHGNLWWHIQYADPQYISTGNPPRDVNEALSLIAGKIAVVFDKFEYTSLRGQDRNWVKGDPNSQNAQLIFPGELRRSNEMVKLTNDYNWHLQEAQRLLVQIEELKDKKEQAESEDLWNKA